MRKKRQFMTNPLQAGGTAPRGARILYVTYDGLTDPLGRSQVLPYLTGLARLGHAITILSCEKAEREATDGPRIAALCEAAGITWSPLRYHPRPPVFSTVYDVRAMLRRAAELHCAAPFEVVHCRSYIPAIVGRRLQRRHGLRFLFDMRGFWPEEKVDGGHWPQSNPLFRAVYRWFKGREAEFLENADHVVSLTRAGERELLARPGNRLPPERISVIPCCVDFRHFTRPPEAMRLATRATLGLRADAPVLVYLGSLGGNYMLGELLDFFVTYRARNPGAMFLFVTQDKSDMILAAARERGIAVSDIVVRPASREEVPLFVSAGDIGVAFKQPVFSSKGCSPTKLGEMLALGIPVVANDGVGDVEQIVDELQAGAILNAFDDESYSAALSDLAGRDVPGEEVRKRALQLFDVETGIAALDRIYRALAAQQGLKPTASNTASNRA
jgi:glycosyltransferase involved in cell wall biosynthesis